jgi:acetyl-CoA synthetase
VYYPSEKTINKAYIKDRSVLDKKAKEDLPGFWADFANELHWFKKWDKMLDDSEKPFYKWFTGEKQISHIIALTGILILSGEINLH